MYRQCAHAGAGVFVLVVSLLLGACGTASTQDAAAATSARSARSSAPQARGVPATGIRPSSRQAATASDAPAYSLDGYAVIPAPWLGEGEPPDAPLFNSVQIGDVTGDGRNDIVAIGGEITLDTPYELLAYAQQPDHSYALSDRYPMSLEGAVFSAMGDFNEDGIQDLVVSGGSEFTLFTSNPGQPLVPHTQSIYDPIGLESQVPAIARDINGDGHLDLVFYLVRGYGVAYTTATFPRIVVWYGDGLGGFGGRFSMKTYGTDPVDTESPISIASGDLNADGSVDIAVRVRQFDYRAQIQRQLVRPFLNDGSGALVRGADINATMDVGGNYSSLFYIAIGDFNRDGRDDLAGSPGSMDMRLWILRQSAYHRFDTTPLVRSGEPIGTALVAADLDNNGEQDLLVAHDGWGRVTYYLQQDRVLGDKQMREFVFDGPRIEPTGLAVGDVDGDQCLDAVVAASYDGLMLMRGSNCNKLKAPVTPTACRTQVPVNGTIGASPAAKRRAWAQNRAR